MVWILPLNTSTNDQSLNLFCFDLVVSFYFSFPIIVNCRLPCHLCWSNMQKYYTSVKRYNQRFTTYLVKCISPVTCFSNELYDMFGYPYACSISITYWWLFLLCFRECILQYSYSAITFEETHNKNTISTDYFIIILQVSM